MTIKTAKSTEQGFWRSLNLPLFTVILLKEGLLADSVHAHLVDDHGVLVLYEEAYRIRDVFRSNETGIGEVRSCSADHIGFHPAGTDGMNSDTIPGHFFCNALSKAIDGVL